MVRHDLKSTSEDELRELDTVDPADAATRTEKLQAQLQSSQRLNEYYNQVVAEIRATLERVDDEG